MFGPSTMLSAATAGIEPPTAQASKRPTRSAFFPRALNSIGAGAMALPPFPGGQKDLSDATRSPGRPFPPPRVDVQQGCCADTLQGPGAGCQLGSETLHGPAASPASARQPLD